MGKKRKNLGLSSDGEADDLGYDLRLVRLWKRRCIANKYIKLNSVGNCFPDENFVDFLDSLSSVLTCDDSVPNHICYSSDKYRGHIDVDTGQNDDIFPKNGTEDANGAFGNVSDGGSFQTRPENHDISQNDHLDHNDPHYELFLKNVRKDRKSFVLDIPARDGISQIIQYERGDVCRVENPDTSRSSQEGSFECNLFDESYDKFMKSLKNEKGLVVYMPESCLEVVYNEDVDESSSDSDVVILETNPISQSYDIPMDDEEAECDKGASKNDCWFREKVVEILKKPFDQAEYDRLLHEVRVHKPAIEEREMRNGRSRRRLVHNTLGKSYLDVHYDLRGKIYSARSKPKVLNLLRGFFYWLQNTPHDVFKPWDDELCLQVLPSEVGQRNATNIL